MNPLSPNRWNSIEGRSGWLNEATVSLVYLPAWMLPMEYLGELRCTSDCKGHVTAPNAWLAIVAMSSILWGGSACNFKWVNYFSTFTSWPGKKEPRRARGESFSTLKKLPGTGYLGVARRLTLLRFAHSFTALSTSSVVHWFRGLHWGASCVVVVMLCERITYFFTGRLVYV